MQYMTHIDDIEFEIGTKYHDHEGWESESPIGGA